MLCALTSSCGVDLFCSLYMFWVMGLHWVLSTAIYVQFMIGKFSDEKNNEYWYMFSLLRLFCYSRDENDLQAHT